MSEVVQRILKKKGIQVLTGARIERIEGLPGAVKARQKVRLTISLAHPVYHEQPSAHHEHASIRRDEAPAHRNHVASYRDETIVPPGTAPHEQTSAQSIQIEGEQLLLATGRTPNTERLRLERAGVQLGRRGEIIVDETLATHTPHIFAAGDVTLGSQYVYVAAYEGKLAAHNALSDNGGSDRIDRNLTVVHSVIFTDPQIATVGLTEEAARTRGLAVTVARLSLTDIARARVRYEEEGAYKLIFDQASLRLLGAEIIAPEAGEVIYAATLAVKFGLTRDDLVDTFVPYLTMAEGLRLTALSIQKDVRKLSCCAG
ncbi:MAG: FAD-dependent oxidoreductase [Candidatus Carbobacillus altaicus]|nr:FAD-dependent oxidoreductase [Candidatus Carbobacillus altaicus]